MSGVGFRLYIPLVSLTVSVMQKILMASVLCTCVTLAAEPEARETAEHWLARAEKRQGTWWGDWTDWLNTRTGERVAAYPAFNRKFPALCDAPGVYVMEP